MPNARVIKRTDGIIQVQHRVDEVYDDTTLPEGTASTDVADEVVVDVTQLDDVEEPQTQLDVDTGALVKDLTQQTVPEELKAKMDAAEATLADLDGDPNVSADVKKYLQALCDAMNVGPNRTTRPQPSTTRS